MTERASVDSFLATVPRMKHFGEILEVPGFVGAQLHRVAGGAPGALTYMAIYELEGDPAVALAHLDGRLKSGALAPPAAGDVKSIKRALYERASARATSSIYGRYTSQFTKLGTTAISRVTPKSCNVLSFR